MDQQKILDMLQTMAEANALIDVVWLYGSQVKGNADENSDYDVAIACDQREVAKWAYYADDLAEQWTKKMQEQVSIVDINQAPTPLAYSIINDGKILYCRDPLRLHTEQMRVWSLWEAFRYEYRHKTENNYEPYVLALTEQVEQYLSGLNELSDLALQRPLTFNERSATERSLQVIIEAAIECSKHYLKSKNYPVPSEARASIERVYERLAISHPGLNDMRGAIGMRNAIIHDYLNLDWEKINDILKQKKYHLVNHYINKVTKRLVEE